MNKGFDEIYYAMLRFKFRTDNDKVIKSYADLNAFIQACSVYRNSAEIYLLKQKYPAYYPE